MYISNEELLKGNYGEQVTYDYSEVKKLPVKEQIDIIKRSCKHRNYNDGFCQFKQAVVGVGCKECDKYVAIGDVVDVDKIVYDDYMENEKTK